MIQVKGEARLTGHVPVLTCKLHPRTYPSSSWCRQWRWWQSERSLPSSALGHIHWRLLLSLSQIHKGSLMTTLFGSEILFPFTHTMAFIWQLKAHLFTCFSFQYSFKEVGEDDFPTIYIQNKEGPHVLISNVSLTQVASYSVLFTCIFYIIILITFPEYKSHIVITWFYLFSVENFRNTEEYKENNIPNPKI